MRAGVLACLLIAAAQPGVWMRLLTGYEGDDFWTLDCGRGAGLALIAAALCLALLWGGARVSGWIRARGGGAFGRAIVDASMKACGFAVLYLLSPQLFYAYYRQIIPGLPNQWVIRWPEAEHVLRALAFAPEARLAEHLAAALFWGVILQALWAQAGSARARVAAGGAVVAVVWVTRFVG